MVTIGFGFQPMNRERKTALLALAVLVASGGGALPLFHASSNEQPGRTQTSATVIDASDQCRYAVRKVAHTAVTYGRTVYIDCATADQVAARQNYDLREVQRITRTRIRFVTATGEGVVAEVDLGRQVGARAGTRVDVLYLDRNPSSVTEAGKPLSDGHQ